MKALLERLKLTKVESSPPPLVVPVLSSFPPPPPVRQEHMTGRQEHKPIVVLGDPIELMRQRELSKPKSKLQSVIGLPGPIGVSEMVSVPVMTGRQEHSLNGPALSEYQNPPNLTYAGGKPIYLTDTEVQADVSRWATYPAIATVIMDGNNIEGASDIGTSTLSATQSIGSPVLNLLRGPGGVPGVINMRDNNGTNHTLESIDANLFFDDELLAKAGDIQNISDWALYPALANVDMDNKSIVNCGSITTIPSAIIDNTEGTIKVLNLDLGPDDSARIKFTNEFGVNKDLKLEVGGGGHLQWGGENVVVGDVVTSLDGIAGDIDFQSGPGILIGPGLGPQNISISAPTIGEAADPPGPATAYGQANQAILDAAEAAAEAAEALAAAEVAQATADAAAAEAAAATAAIGVVEGEVVALQGEVAALTVEVGLIQASYVTKVGLEANQRSGEITLKPGANLTITEAPNGTFTFASTAGGGGVTSLNGQAGALTLTSANTNIVVGSIGAGNIELTSTLPFDLNGLLNKINAFPTQPYTSATASTPAANQVATAIVPDGSFPVNVPTVGSVQGGWGFSKAVGSPSYFNWYSYNPRFSNPAAALPYIKSRVQSVWALIRPTVNLYLAGYLSFNIYSYDPANPPTSGFYNTRWAYSNSVGAVAGAAGTNLFAGYTYLIYANDSPRITNTSAIGVPDSQVSTLRDPYDIYTDVNHIPLQNCVVAFNPWTNGTNYRTWTAAATFALNDTVVFAGSGTNFNGLFFRSLSVNNNNHPPMTNGVVDTNWALIDPQPSTYADQPILAINLNQATASAQAVGYVVLDIGFSYGPNTTSTTDSVHISLNPN
jgi:hypothetical protein